MNDLNEMEQDNNRAGPSHDPSQHPAGIGAWHVTGDRSNAGGVVGSVAGAPGTTDEVFLAAQEPRRPIATLKGFWRQCCLSQDIQQPHDKRNLEVHRWIPKGLLEVDLDQILPAVLQDLINHHLPNQDHQLL